jgi:DNA-binding beta-propeller fold protein YncE
MLSLRICRLVLSVSALLCTSVSAERKPLFTSPLPTGVRLDPAGEAVDLGSLPINLVPTPEKDSAVVVLSGWREQGVQVVDLKTRKVTQTLLQDGAFYGAAFSPDGHRLCVSGGNSEFELAKAKTADGTGISYPAGLAFSPNGKFLYVAEDVGDRLAVVNAATGEITQRFSTDHYPYGVALTTDGQVFVSAWGGSTVSQFRVLPDGTLAYLGRIEVGPHPSALVVRGTSMYITLAGSDRVAVVDTKLRTVARYLHDAAPGAPPEGSTPNAVALTSDGKRLLVAEADNNAVAVFDVGTGKLLGRVPTDWYPTAIAEVGDQLLVLSGKGHGTHANPDGPVPLTNWPDEKPTAYVLGQLDGTLRVLSASLPPPQLASFTERVVAANNWQHKPAARSYPPFRHVVYIIKENRTYDQVLGDMKEGDGDASLVYFPDITITPNHHALARRFGLFDRFFVNAEVSSQGHIWSTAA